VADAVSRRGPIGLAEFRDILATPPLPTWQAVIVTLAAGDGSAFRTLCSEHRITIVDTIERQLAELARVRFPAAGQDPQRREFASGVDGDAASYGAWAYLPWESRVVHLLADDDFFDVITDRNRDKITQAEQRILRHKYVGVLGLSVGGEAAVTLAQEHLCGHIKLADFDELELSNLNRLNAGVDDLGVPKAWIVARRIAKIDPYLRVTVFDGGVTPANIDTFLDGLDLLVEECDDLAVKYDIRVRAKARALDVVYAADERGFLSVEPYRTHPDLPVFHNLVDGRPPRRDELPSPAAFMRALTAWLGGWASISARSRRSADLVGQSLSGFPQLAGEARFAAGQVAHVARRLLLNEAVAPFHDHLDLTDMLPPSV
jgi:molybdopterin/thiamine biosynthesis adenylyltransferase